MDAIAHYHLTENQLEKLETETYEHNFMKIYKLDEVRMLCASVHGGMSNCIKSNILRFGNVVTMDHWLAAYKGSFDYTNMEAEEGADLLDYVLSQYKETRRGDDLLAFGFITGVIFDKRLG